MILLDTNYLILMLVADSPEARDVQSWVATQESLCTSSVCWYEFVTGPVDDHGIRLVQSVVHNRIVPFSAEQAVISARLFNATGRIRRTRIDAMVAAAAIETGSTLATRNRSDFEVFTGHGLHVLG